MVPGRTGLNPGTDFHPPACPWTKWPLGPSTSLWGGCPFTEQVTALDWTLCFKILTNMFRQAFLLRILNVYPVELYVLHAKSLQSCLAPCDHTDYISHQPPLTMGFSRQGSWSGLPFPSPGDLPDPGVEPMSPALASRLFFFYH